MELGVRNHLESLGVETFVPTVTGRRSRGSGSVEKPLLNCIVFLKSTKTDALDLIHWKGVKADYLFDCATRQMMVVPDKQMEDFQRVMDQSLEEGGLVDKPLEVGEKVRVTKGVLKGVEGYVLELSGKTYVVVSLIGCIFARARVPRAWLEKIG